MVFRPIYCDRNLEQREKLEIAIEVLNEYVMLDDTVEARVRLDEHGVLEVRPTDASLGFIRFNMHGRGVPAQALSLTHSCHERAYEVLINKYAYKIICDSAHKTPSQ